MKKKIFSDMERKERLFEELALEFLSKKYGMNLSKIVESKLKNNISSDVDVLDSFPVAILSQGLSSLEAIVKYMRENKKISYDIIAKLLSRNAKTLAVTYNVAKKKIPKLLDENISLSEQKNIPFKIFDNTLSILESIVKYLHDSGYTYSQIGRMIDKDPRTIWTVYTRVKKKLRIKN
jgi:DNA-directed RNA polymerase specialized sigma24 family protein